MQTIQHEQTGLPDTSYEETPLLESIDNLFNESDISRKLRKAVDKIKTRFPKGNFESLGIKRSTGKNVSKIVTQGSKKGEYKILKDDDSDFMKSFLDNFKHKLGPPA